MRWGLLAVRLSIVAVNLIIIAIILMSVLPLATGKVQVAVPEDEGTGPVMDGRKVTMSVPVDITNDGYFDIEGLTVRFKITDGGRVLSERSSEPVDAKAGRINHLNISIMMDLDEIDEEHLERLVFGSGILDLDVTVEGGYSLGLVRASISIREHMDWEPMVKGVEIDTSKVWWENNGSNMDMLVPYHFEASGILRGERVAIEAEIVNSTSALGSASAGIIIGDVNDGELRFVVPQDRYLWLQEHPEKLTLVADISVMGATMHLERPLETGGVT